MKIRRTQITIRSERVLIVRPFEQFTAWCAECGGERLMVSIDDAAAIADSSSREILQRVEKLELHSAETIGRLLICLDSLAAGGKSDSSTLVRIDECRRE